ncbi:hypothetical protein E1265_00860 [Streptomyces sp. 8K308]|uniref:hypothetical protein n=1 Tax=Streptomyces sp. 8K308 TaxID=2530388 RepID=UPI001042E836|nr:hypothetical protein [Streptomyces sp. 8K308]TDC27694.1 hypothetical protein E1265_00860 [Streptomyces sp. 8K308]
MDFSGRLDTLIATLAENPWSYQVDGHVDADNEHGIPHRTTYTCTLSTADGEAWTLDDLVMS